MSEAPIIKAFKELEEGKILKDWGTQTEKEDAPASNSYFHIPEHVFTGFSLFACLWLWYSQHSNPPHFSGGIKKVCMQTCGVLLRKFKVSYLSDLFRMGECRACC